jgi:1,4-alpha-glucan branching enzyme
MFIDLELTGIYMKKNNLLLVSYDFPPKSVWGVAKHVDVLRKEMARHFNVDVSTRFDENGDASIPSNEFTDNNLIKSRFLPLESYVDFEYLMAWNYLLGKKIISKYQNNLTNPHIVHNHTWMTFPAALQVSRFFNSKLVSSMHFLERQYSGFQDIPTEIDLEDILKVENAIVRESDALIVFGENHKNFVIDNYAVNKTKLCVVHHGLDLDDYKDYLASPSKSSESVVINFVGRIVPEKGIVELISAVDKLKERYPYIQLNLIGEGNLRGNIQNDQHVVSHGFLSPEKVSEMNQGADIFCFPSYTETFGYAVLEAMACGLPIICSRGKKVEKLLYDDEALFVDIDYSNPVSVDSKQLEQHLETLITSPKLRKELASKSVSASKRYCQSDMLIKIKDVYDSLRK